MIEYSCSTPGRKGLQGDDLRPFRAPDRAARVLLRSKVPRGHFSRPGRFFAIRTAALLSQPLFQLPERPSFLDGRFFGFPSPHLSSRTGIPASRTLVFPSGALSFFRSRYLASGTAILATEAARIRFEPLSCFRSAHPAPGSLIRAFEAAIFFSSSSSPLHTPSLCERQTRSMARRLPACRGE